MKAIDFSSKHSQERLDLIVGTLDMDGPMTVRELAPLIGVSAVTLRPYLAHLQECRVVHVCDQRSNNPNSASPGRPSPVFAVGKSSTITNKGPDGSSGSAAPLALAGGRHIHTQFDRPDWTPPIVRRDPMVAAFFGSACAR
ncbi:TPA: hypothetical protein QDB28_005689 [Burkholderia vietnamiensis]|nr:hypothetical protein [Burkholderia vietnamiensis]